MKNRGDRGYPRDLEIPIPRIWGYLGIFDWRFFGDFSLGIFGDPKSPIPIPGDF